MQFLVITMNKSLSAKTKTNSWANARFDQIRSWSQVRRDLLNSSTLNKEDWDVTLSSGIEVNENGCHRANNCLLSAARILCGAGSMKVRPSVRPSDPSIDICLLQAPELRLRVGLGVDPRGGWVWAQGTMY